MAITLSTVKKQHDWELTGAALLLVIAGLATIYSVTGGGVEFTRQLLFLVPAVILYLLISELDYHLFQHYSREIYLLNIFLLVLVLLIGHSALGAQRWIDLGGIKIQPSEFAKFALILLLAKYFQNLSFRSWTEMIQPLALTALPMALIFLQPDLGSSMVFIALFLGMLLWKGAPPFYFVIFFFPILSLVLSIASFWYWLAFFGLLLLCAYLFLWEKGRTKFWILGFMVALMGLAGPAVWDHLHDYQQKRVLVFLDPNIDPRGAGYHVIQSQIAIGSGQIIGKGYMQGTQTQLHFIPEQHTDFVFSAFGEEFGLAGGIVLLALYLVIIYKGITIARTARDSFGSLLAIGIVSYFLFHVFINIGMVSGLVPVVGIPLPLVSYGGSSLILSAIALAMLQAIHRRSRKSAL